MRRFAALLRRVTWPSVAAHPGRSFLTLTGIAVGVAVFLAVRLANVSIVEAFSTSLDLFAGTAQLTVSRPGFGLDEELLPRIEADPAVRAAEPQVVGTVVVAEPPREVLLLYGIDLVRSRPTGTTLVGVGGREEGWRDRQAGEGSGRPAGGEEAPPRGAGEGETPLIARDDAILVTEAFARSRGLRVGDRLEVLAGPRRVPLVVRGLMVPESRSFLERTVAVMDLAAAQPLLGRLGRLDGVSLVLREGADVEAVRARLAAALPPGVVIDRPLERSGQVEQMLAAFRLNLTILSLIALLVGILLVYNTLAFSVAQRRREIGVLRAIGASRRDVQAAFVCEGILYGVVGGVAGVLGGLALARGTLRAMATTVSALYLHAPVERLRITPEAAALGLFLGVAVSAVSAWGPARAAARVPPREPIALGTAEADAGLRARRRALRLAGVAAAALAGASLLTLPGPIGGQPVGGYAAAFAVLAGFLLLAPAAVLALGRLTRPLAARLGGPPGRLAADHFVLALRRNAATVGALLVSLAMLVSIWIMVTAFRETVDAWIVQTVRADLVATPAARLAGSRDAAMPAGLAEAMRRLPGVAELDAVRAAEVRYRGHQVVLAAGDLGLQARHGRLLFLPGTPADAIARARALRGAFVSEAFARRFDRWPGSTVTLDLPAGRRTYPIVGVFADYTTDRGLVVIDAPTYVADTGQTDVLSVALYLTPGADPGVTRRALERLVGSGGTIAVVSNRELRARVLDIFDQTFAITFALQLIAVAVSAIAVVNTLVASIMERQAELGILRAVGLGGRELRRLVRWEAGLIGAAASLLGGAAGVVLSWLLVFVINRQAFGWTIRYHLAPEVLPTTALLAVATALVAATWPARRAATTPIAQAVRYE